MTYALPIAASTDIDIRHWLAAFGVAAALHAAVFLQWPADDQAGAEAPGVGGISVSIAMAASLAGADHSSDNSALVEKAPVEQLPVEQVAEALAEPTLPEPVPPSPVEPTVTPPIQEAVTQPVAEVPVPEIVPETVTETPPVEEITPVEQVAPVPDMVTAVEPPPEEVPVADPVTEAPTETVIAEIPSPRAPVRPAVIQPPTVQAKPVEIPKAPEAPPAPVPTLTTAPVTNPNPAQVQQTPSSSAATVSSGQAANAPVGNATDVRNSTGGAAVSAPSPNYIATLRLWLERHKDYPKMARRKRMQGVVLVYFRVGRDGTVLAQEIRELSGHALLDEAALEMLARATPLPEFPKDMPGDYLDVVLPVEYSLRGNQ